MIYSLIIDTHFAHNWNFCKPKPIFLTCRKQFIRKSKLMHFSFLEANVPIVSHMLSSDQTQARARSPSGAAPGTVKDALSVYQPVGLCSSSANDSTLTCCNVFTATFLVVSEGGKFIFEYVNIFYTFLRFNLKVIFVYISRDSKWKYKISINLHILKGRLNGNYLFECKRLAFW